MTRREAPISPPVVLTVAGSDSGGGAGIQADLKTIEACGGFGTSAITSVTAQNTQGVQGAHHLPIDGVDAQIQAVCDDFDVTAVKTGMLATGDVIDLVVDHADALPNLVVDPVMVATSGDRLLAEEAEAAYERLVAESTLVTPNADEADVLTDVTVDDRESAERAGRILVEELGADAALVKGGHVPGDHVVDTLVRAGDAGASEPTVTTYRHDRIETDATHGSGCTLSSAIATRLAHDDDLQTAVGAGIDLLSRAVRYTVDVGRGPGAVHHLVDLRNDASSAATIDLVHVLVDRFRAADWDDLVPASGIKVAASTPYAEEPVDVAAVAERLAAKANGSASGGGADRDATSVRFGADDRLASLLLAAREGDPARRFAALVRSDRGSLAALDGEVRSLEGNPSSEGHSIPPDADSLTPLREGKPAPVAVSIAGEDATADTEPLAVVFADATSDLLAHLETLASD